MSMPSPEMPVSPKGDTAGSSKAKVSFPITLPEDIEPDWDEVARVLYNKARREEPATTRVIQRISNEYEGVLIGIEFRIKSEESIQRKLRATKDEDLITDALRYTLLFPTRIYTRSVKESIKVMNENDLETLVISNYWSPDHCYRGINAVFVAPSGIKVELQMHTPDSYEAKQFRLHSFYEVWRTESDPQKKYDAYMIMVLLVDEVPTPKGILDVGTLKKKEFIPPPSVDKDLSLAIAERTVADIREARAAFGDFTSLVHSISAAHEGTVTAAVKRVNADLQGLLMDFHLRIKTPECINGKFHETAKTNHLPAREVMTNLHADGWSLRYFCVFPTAEYTSKVMQFCTKLSHFDYMVVKIKNFWDDAEIHDGVVVVFETPLPLEASGRRTTEAEHGFRFQIKFHTHESFHGRHAREDLARRVAHSLGDMTPSSDSQFRSDMIRYNQDMRMLWASIPRPKGVLLIGDLEYAYDREESHQLSGVKLHVKQFLSLDAPARQRFLSDLRGELTAYEKAQLVGDLSLIQQFAGNGEAGTASTPTRSGLTPVMDRPSVSDDDSDDGGGGGGGDVVDHRAGEVGILKLHRDDHELAVARASRSLRNSRGGVEPRVQDTHLATLRPVGAAAANASDKSEHQFPSVGDNKGERTSLVQAGDGGGGFSPPDRGASPLRSSLRKPGASHGKPLSRTRAAEPHQRDTEEMAEASAEATVGSVVRDGRSRTVVVQDRHSAPAALAQPPTRPYYSGGGVGGGGGGSAGSLYGHHPSMGTHMGRFGFYGAAPPYGARVAAAYAAAPAPVATAPTEIVHHHHHYHYHIDGSPENN